MNFVGFFSISVKDNWLQIDLSHPTRVTALVTKGRGDRGEQWVTKYIIAFSNDTRLWVYYNDAQRIEPKVRSNNSQNLTHGLSNCLFLFQRSSVEILIDL